MTPVTWALVLLASTASAETCPCVYYEFGDSYFEFDCVDPSLTEIPDCVTDDATMISVANNRIAINGSTFSRFPNLRTVGIRNMSLLDYLPVDVFKGNPQLSDLFISDTPLQYVSPEVFQYTPGVIVLDVNNNDLRIVTPDTFKYLPWVEFLSLKGNAMTTLFPEAFASNGYLKDVNLRDNPWVCDCTLMRLRLYLVSSGIFYPCEGSCECANPPELRGRSWDDAHELLQCDL